MATDKNDAIIKYLLQCDEIANNPLFFNFADRKDGNNQLITSANDKMLQRPYIDGSVLKLYTITILTYKSISYNAVVKQEGYPDENVSDFGDVQKIVDWIEEQNDLRNFPDFGKDCSIEEVEALSANPVLNGVDDSVSPPLVQYGITLRIQYIDNSKVIWK